MLIYFKISFLLTPLKNWVPILWTNKILVLVVNRSEPEAEDSTKTVREISLFVDGVKENMDYTYFENLFNKYGLVSKVAHR